MKQIFTFLFTVPKGSGTITVEVNMDTYTGTQSIMDLFIAALQPIYPGVTPLDVCITDIKIKQVFNETIV